MVALNLPTIRVHVLTAVDDPADAGPDNRPEAERLTDMIASVEHHLNGMVGIARENFQEALDAMKARLEELRRQGQDAEPAPTDERQNPTP